jgi:hypothetical protein
MAGPYEAEFRDRSTGEALGRQSFGSREEALAFIEQRFKNRKVDFRQVGDAKASAAQRFGFGVAEGVSGVPDALAMAGSLVGSAVKNRMMGPLSREPASFGSTPRVLARKNEAVAGALGMPDVPDPNDPNLAQSAGRGLGGVVYGPLRAPAIAGNFAAEGADYGIQKSGGGMLARFAGSLLGGVGAEQLAGSAANRRAVGGAVRGVANRRGIKAWNRVKTLDMVEDSFAEALEISKGRAERMLTFGQGSWDKFDQTVKRGMNAKGTEFAEGGIVTVDPSDLFRSANYVWTSTAPEFRGELPKVISALVERSKAVEKGGASRMTLTELRSFHVQVNDLWKQAAHRNASPLSEMQAAKADELRGAIEGIYQNLLTPFHEPSVPNPMRGPTLPQGRGVVEAPMTRGTMALPEGRGQGTSYMPSPLNREQAGALQTALESSRQLGSEIDALKRAGFDLASGKPIEPVKMLNAILQPGARIDSPELAQDMLAIVTREDPVRGKAALSQSWMDYVFGPQGEFTQREALKRLNLSRAVGNIWADKDKVAALEGVIRSMGNKQSKDHTFANLVGGGLGIMGGGIASGGDFPHGLIHGALVGGATIAGASAPRLFIYLKERYGAEAVSTLMREMVFDRAKYFKLKKIADGVPTAKDFEWVDIQLRSSLLKASGRAARQSQGEPQ